MKDFNDGNARRDVWFASLERDNMVFFMEGAAAGNFDDDVDDEDYEDKLNF